MVELCSVVSLYANSDVFPIVVCICEMKSPETWKWFLSILREWLEIEDDILVTFMTNRQKGLLASLAEFWPRSTVRYCARHLFANVRSNLNKCLELCFSQTCFQSSYKV